jgi:transposase
MGPGPLLPASSPLVVQWVRFGEIVQVGLSSQATHGKCPRCGGPSARVHSHHVRTVADSPAHGRVIELVIHLRRFFCPSSDCPQQTFAQQMPDLMHRGSRKTCRLVCALQEIGLAVGGEAGARLASKLSVPVSPDTLLRLIRRIPAQTIVTPRVLGVDDWSFKRGRQFGTILCDLESHRPVDLLPDRSAAGLAHWLEAHPGVQWISRDRGGEYAKGAAQGAPEAIQVADRFHLVHNLTQAFERALDRRHALLDEAAKASASAAGPAGDRCDGPAPAQAATTRQQRKREESRVRRKALYDQVQRLQSEEVSIRQIARRLGLNSHTVMRYAHAQQFPEYASHPTGPTPLDKFVPYLKRRWEEGCRSGVELYRELREQGFAGSVHMVRRQLTAWRDSSPGRMACAAPRWRPSARAVTWLLLKEQNIETSRPAADPPVNEQMSVSGQESLRQAFLAALHGKWPELAENVWMVQEFRRVLSQDDPAQLQAWVDLSGESTVLRPIRQFAMNLRRDWDAVVQAVRQPWSNGQVEGQVNRLKMIKRQMYGRAGFDLLRARVLQMN